MGFKVLYILLVIGMLGNVKIIFYMYISGKKKLCIIKFSIIFLYLLFVFIKFK